MSQFSLVGGFFEGTRENILHTFRSKVRPQDPATFLIYHTDRKDHNRKDRFILDVDSKIYMDKDKEKENENFCMIVSVYNQECPLHNKPGNVKVLLLRLRLILSNFPWPN